MVNAAATVEIMNEHPSLRDAIWRFMAASMLLRNPQWVKDATQASVAMAAANTAQGAMVLPAGVSARDLALSIVRPHQSRGGWAKAGYLAVLSNYSGTKSSSVQQGLLEFNRWIFSCIYSKNMLLSLKTLARTYKLCQY